MKLENEVKSESLESVQVNESEISNFSSTSFEQAEHQTDNVENSINATIEEKDEKIETEEENSNGLENFQIDEEATPNLFNSDDSENNENTISSESTIEDNKEEDDLEIPAFLRRQKN